MNKYVAIIIKKLQLQNIDVYPQLFFQVIMYFSMIEVGLLAQKWAAPQQWSATQRWCPEATVAAMVNGQPFAHARVLKVQSLFDMRI